MLEYLRKVGKPETYNTKKQKLMTKQQTARGVGMALALLGIMAAQVCTSSRAATITQTANDALGTSSFNAAGTWSPAGAPSAGNDYVSAGYLLRGPASGTSYTFAGDSLTIGGGNGGGANPYNLNGLANNNSLLFTLTGQTLTVNNLILDAGSVRDGNGVGNVTTLAGNVTITANGGQFLCQDTNFIASKIMGSGLMIIGDNGNTDVRRVSIFTSGASTFNGSIWFTNTTTDPNRSRAIWDTTSILNFTIGANGVNNNIGGLGTAGFNGAFNFDLSGADNTLGDSWTIVNTSSSSYGGTFSVNGFTQNGSLWDNAIGNGNQYEYNTATGILTVAVVPEPSAFVLAGLGLAGLVLIRARRRQA
jgi:hypothetical protein